MNARYWDERVRRRGHTGWSDPATYRYDQRLRLRAIHDVVQAELPVGGDRALDFGCGVGDFCIPLARTFAHVVGYDISTAAVQRARSREHPSNVAFTDNVEMALARPVDLVLAITVLQHVVRDEDLRAQLDRLAAALTPAGRIVVMETLGEWAGDRKTIRNRSLPDLLGFFEAAGLELVTQHHFYHPRESPTPTYRCYEGHLAVRALSRLEGLRVPLAGAVLDRFARHHADLDDAYLDQPDSPTKILVFRTMAASR